MSKSVFSWQYGCTSYWAGDIPEDYQSAPDAHVDNQCPLSNARGQSTGKSKAYKKDDTDEELSKATQRIGALHKGDAFSNFKNIENSCTKIRMFMTVPK